MCLATIYGKKQENETILLKNASRIDVDGRLQQSGCGYSLIVSADRYLDPEHAWMM